LGLVVAARSSLGPSALSAPWSGLTATAAHP